STALRASMIQTIIHYLDGLSRNPGSDPSFELEIADSYREVANLEGHPFRQNLGQPSVALDHYEKAIRIYERHTSHADTKSRALTGLIETYIQAGDIEARAGNTEAAKARLRHVVALATDVAAQDPSILVPDTWIYLYFRLGSAELDSGAPEAALNYFRKAL